MMPKDMALGRATYVEEVVKSTWWSMSNDRPLPLDILI